MTFYTYMARNHKDDALTAVMRKDRERFPRNGCWKLGPWHRIIRDHLNKRDEYAGLLDAFEKRWEEYEACARRK